MEKRENRMDPKHWKSGDLVMLSCFVYLADGSLHPNCGQICRIVTPAKSDKAPMTVEFDSDDTEGRGSYLILPREYFLPIPDFMCEEWSRHPGHRAWRVKASDKKWFETMEWPSTPATFGGEK